MIHAFCRKLLVIGLIMGLSACGFKPMYGQFSDQQKNFADTLSVVQIGDVRDGTGRPSRLSQAFRNTLLDRLTPYGASNAAQYILKVNYTVEESGYGISSDESVNLLNIRLLATYQLVDITTDKPVLDKIARALVTFDIARSDYSNLVARNAALKRLADDVSIQMTTRIGAFLSQKTAAVSESPATDS